MKTGVWLRLRRFFSTQHVTPLEAAMTVGLSVKDFQSLAQDEKLPSAALKKLEHKYGLRSEYVLTGTGPITIEADEQPHERIISVRKKLGLSQTQFAQGFGLTQSGQSALELGTIPPRRMMALAIEAAYGVSHEWLLYGKPPKYMQSHFTIEERRLLDRFRAADKDVQSVTLKLLDSTTQNREPWDGSAERRDEERRERGVAGKAAPPKRH